MIVRFLLFFSILFPLVAIGQKVPPRLEQLYNELEHAKGTKKADIYRQIGDYASDANDYLTAIDYHQKALEIFRSTNDLQGERNTLLSISSNYWRMKYADKSLEYVNLLLKKATKANDYRNLAGAYNNLALIEDYSGKKKESISSLKKAYRYSKNISDTLYIKVAIVNNLALSYSSSGYQDSAWFYLNKALSLSVKTNNQYCIAGAYLNLANLIYEKADYSNALDTLRLAINIAEKYNYLDIALPSTNLLSKIYDATGMKDSAMIYLKKVMVIKDSLLKKQNNESIRNAETRSAIKEKEHENEILLKNNEIKNLQIESQKNWLWTFAIGFIVVLILFVIVLYQFRQQQLANISLVKRNLEIISSEMQLKEATVTLQNTSILHPDPEKKISGVVIQEEQKKDLILNLLQLFEEKKIYTNHQLSINSLASELNTNRTYLSQIIKDHFKTGFSEMLNNYRVGEARRLLADKEYSQFTVDHIGTLAGFSSRANFYAVFKQYTGVTPSYFQKSASVLLAENPDKNE
jgi:AraC-like DNA-binding protein